MVKKRNFVGILVMVLVFMTVGTVSAQTYSDSEARQILENAGIGVNAFAPQTLLHIYRIILPKLNPEGTMLPDIVHHLEQFMEWKQIIGMY
jgi:hypothetical protein